MPNRSRAPVGPQPPVDAAPLTNNRLLSAGIFLPKLYATRSHTKHHQARLSHRHLMVAASTFLSLARALPCRAVPCRPEDTQTDGVWTRLRGDRSDRHPMHKALLSSFSLPAVREPTRGIYPCSPSPLWFWWKKGALPDHCPASAWFNFREAADAFAKRTGGSQSRTLANRRRANPHKHVSEESGMARLGGNRSRTAGGSTQFKNNAPTSCSRLQ